MTFSAFGFYLAFIILKFTGVAGFNMLHLPFGIRLSVFNFQLSAFGIHHFEMNARGLLVRVRVSAIHRINHYPVDKC